MQGNSCTHYLSYVGHHRCQGSMSQITCLPCQWQITVPHHWYCHHTWLESRCPTTTAPPSERYFTSACWVIVQDAGEGVLRVKTRLDSNTGASASLHGMPSPVHKLSNPITLECWCSFHQKGMVIYQHHLQLLLLLEVEGWGCKCRDFSEGLVSFLIPSGGPWESMRGLR